MILVNAANGNQGKLLVPKLIAKGLPVRACVQSEASALHLRALGVNDVIVGDIMQPDVLRSAFDGVRKVFHIGPTLHPQEREMGIAFIEMARKAGVEHFVFSSVLHAITTDLVQHELKRDVEEHLLSSGLEFTILQPSNYMLPLKLKPVFDQGVFRLSWSLDRHQSMVDLEDVTEVVVEVLTNSADHAGATYELVGPGRFTGHDIGKVISRVIGRNIPVEEISADTYLKAWCGDGDPADFPHQASVLRSISKRYSSHDFIGNPNVLRWLLGREPTSFEQFVRRQYQAFVSARVQSNAI